MNRQFRGVIQYRVPVWKCQLTTEGQGSISENKDHSNLTKKKSN